MSTSQAHLWTLKIFTKLPLSEGRDIYNQAWEHESVIHTLLYNNEMKITSIYNTSLDHMNIVESLSHKLT